MTGLLQGFGIVASSPTLGVLNATTGTFFVNQAKHSESVPFPGVIAGPGLAGGHFDVDTNSEISLDNGDGSTDAHIHEYDDKHDVTGVDYFNFHDDSLHEIDEDIPENNQKFKLIIVNADKSPGGRLVINQTYDPDDPDPITYTDVTTYDDIPIAELPVYWQEDDAMVGDVPVTELNQLGMYFDVLAILERELIPTQTRCVRKNIRSYDGEWRNAALTIWAVAVSDDALTDEFELETDEFGKVTGITSGLLWESTLFWHWNGPCTHEYESLDNDYVDGKSNTPVVNPSTGENISIFEFYRDKTIKTSDKKGKGGKKRKKKGGGTGTGDDTDTGSTPGTEIVVENRTILDTLSPPGWLGNPFRVSWTEL